LLWAHTRAAAVWLQRRPAPGVWAGLYCMPWFASREELVASLPAQYHAALQDLEAFKHVLTHKDLHLHPVRLLLPSNASVNPQGKWFDANRWPGLGLPAPVRGLLQA
jgi:A/G-specific adenine glycosylase